MVVRIMPDYHNGKGYVIGITLTIKDKIVPNLVGVDIGCGIKAITLGNINDINLDFVKFDNFIYNSIPHGAGRVLSRNKAIESIPLEKFEESTKGIYTTSECKGTIDESPFAYKSINDIIDNIKETVDIIKIIKPIYNFKARN